MKGGIFFTGTGPIVIITSYDGFTNREFVDKLFAKGLKQFIAYEVPLDQLREKYGNHYNVVLHDLHQNDDLRVLDYDGHRVLNNFKLSELGEPIYYEL